jgi:hypothetical protein
MAPASAKPATWSREIRPRSYEFTSILILNSTRSFIEAERDKPQKPIPCGSVIRSLSFLYCICLMVNLMNPSRWHLRVLPSPVTKQLNTSSPTSVYTCHKSGDPLMKR